MGYLKIRNLGSDQSIMCVKEVFALEKIHGTSTHIHYKKGVVVGDTEVEQLTYFSGGAKHDTFIALFDHNELRDKFRELGHDDVTVYGEGYGGKEQGMRETYGDKLKFVAFDVKVGEWWLNVPNAHDVCNKLGLEFVYYTAGPCEYEWLDAQRDEPSVQSMRNGIEVSKPREGIVIRPTVELSLPSGARLIAKHKGAQFSETRTVRTPTTDVRLTNADDKAREWVTDNRFRNMLTHFKSDEVVIENFRTLLEYMVNDVFVEAGSELNGQDKVLRKSVSSRAAQLIKAYFNNGGNRDGV